PKSGISDWFKLLTDPDENRLRHCLTVGERQTFPKLHMIANRMRIEQSISQCRTTIKERLCRKALGRSAYNSELSSMLSEDSENTVRARMRTFGAGHHFKDSFEGEHPIMAAEPKGRSRRIASWPGLRYALGHESVSDFGLAKSRGQYEEDADQDGGYDEGEEEEEENDDDDEGMGMDYQEDTIL
ncbi:hypothetical protein EC968_005263, partial [Mortierella alpina]